MNQPETFILIPGRTSRQGEVLNEGKLKAAYQEETGTLLMCPDDMQRPIYQPGTAIHDKSSVSRQERSLRSRKSPAMAAAKSR